MNKKILGSIIIIIGLVLLLNSNGLIELNIWDIISIYWPIVLILSGSYSVITNRATKIGGLILLIIGIIFQLRNLNYFNLFDYLDFWPVVIILIGLYLIFASKDKWNSDRKDKISPIAIFSGLKIRNSSQRFKGGFATALFGGMDLDLTQAKIENEGLATLDVFIAFGGLDIIVPEDWNVEIKGLPLFAGWDNKTKNKENDMSPKLRINCLVMFGGMDVKNYRNRRNVE